MPQIIEVPGHGQVEFPDGMSDTDIVAAIKRNAMSAPAPAGKPISRLDRIGHGMMDPIHGGAQLLEQLAKKMGVADAVNGANNWLADKTGLLARVPEGGVDQQIKDREAAYQEARRASMPATLSSQITGQKEDPGFDGYRMLGNVASPVNLALAARIPAAASLARRVVMGTAVGGVSGAMTPVGEGDFWTEKGKQTGTGAAIGGALPVVGGAVARVISPNASRNPNLALLKKEGVQPTIGQALGGTANKVEERMQSAPILGDMISQARGNANSTFQAAAFNRALAPIGQALPEGMAGRDAVAFTESVLKQSYDDVLSQIGAIPKDQAFAAKVTSLQQMVNKDVLSKAAKQKFQMVLNDVDSAFDNGGVLTSDAFKRVESSLGSDARKLAGSQDIYDGRLAPAVKQLQSELRDLLQRQAGQNADDLAAVNTGWANFKRVQNAAGRVGAEDGQFTPAQFQAAVRAMDKSKDKGAFARGSALGQDLGDAGKTVLGNKVPNSGTPERMWMNAGVLGSYLLNPAIPATALGGAGMYLSPVQRALVAAASSRPGAAQPAADAFRKASPMLVPGAAQLGLEMLKY